MDAIVTFDLVAALRHGARFCVRHRHLRCWRPVVDHDIAAPPIGLNEVVNAHRLQFFTYLADENVDDFRVRLIKPAI